MKAMKCEGHSMFTMNSINLYKFIKCPLDYCQYLVGLLDIVFSSGVSRLQKLVGPRSLFAIKLTWKSDFKLILLNHVISYGISLSVRHAAPENFAIDHVRVSYKKSKLLV